MVKKKQKERSIASKVDYDSAWKDLIEELFKWFLEFFFPDIYQDIDFNKKPQFLSNELRKMFKSSKVGKRFADVLVRVYLKDGSTQCIFIHIEVQGTPDPGLPERIYVYNYRIYDHYRELNEEVISLVILTDEDKNFRPDEYYFKRWGFEHKMKIPMVKIIDYKDKIEELEKSDNPMAMVVLAQIKSYEAKKSDNQRKYNIKLNLFRECFKRGYSKDQIRGLVKFIDWVINLPTKYQDKLYHEIIKLEEETKMPYLPTWERTAKKEGKKEGKKEQALKTAKKMLEDDFSIENIMKYTGLSQKEIKALMN
jgi:hypothetical protein